VIQDKGNLSQEESASEKLSITPPITKKPSFEGNSSKSSTGGLLSGMLLEQCFTTRSPWKPVNMKFSVTSC